MLGLQFAALLDRRLSFNRLPAVEISLPCQRDGDGLFEQSPAHDVRASGRLDDHPQLVRLGHSMLHVGTVCPIDFGHGSGRRCFALAQGIREADLLNLLDIKPPEGLLR